MSQPPVPEDNHDETSFGDVKQLGLWAALGSLGYVFWVVGGMEMIERLAYYGVRAVSTIYVTHSVSEGGLGVTMATFGTLMMCWNLVQSLVPICIGGLADRYGYKETIFISTVIKCVGYLLMALLHSYWGFFAGAMCLALGTAIFKPGIQGTLIKVSSRQNSSIAWGVFYQTVNIGGWLGPLIALQMRQMSWTYVFYTNAAIICFNFLLLLVYKEPGKESLQELKKPHLHLYLLIFSVWWFMFPMLWDVLPKYIDDWVDTRTIVTALFGTQGTTSHVTQFLLGMSKDGLRIEPEGLVNINSGLIMLTCFIFAALSAKMRAINSMIIGTVFVVSALILFGMFNVAWVCVAAMAVFSVGEMLASPKYSEFLGNIAPRDKKAMWIGFSQAPVLIGMTLEGKLGPQMYHLFSDKDVFAREMLLIRGFDPKLATEAVLLPGEAFKKLVAFSGETPEALTRALYDQHHIGMTWYLFAVIGVIAAALIYAYGKWLQNLARTPRP
jgi:proton-dependent oligopeptide transporter, POT family